MSAYELNFKKSGCSTLSRLASLVGWLYRRDWVRTAAFLIPMILPAAGNGYAQSSMPPRDFEQRVVEATQHIRKAQAYLNDRVFVGRLQTDSVGHGRLVYSTNLDGALVEAREAMRIAPDWSAPHRLLGIILYKRQDLKEAYSEMDKAIELERKEKETGAGIEISTSSGSGANGPASSPVSSAGGMSQTSPMSQVEILGLLVGGESSHYLTNLVRQRGIDFGILFADSSWYVPEEFLQRVKDAGGNKALDDALRSAQLFPKTLDWLDQAGEDILVDSLYRGSQYEKKGQLARAEQEYRQAVPYAGGNAVLLIDLGNVLMKEEKYREAETQFRAAARLWPGDTPVPHADLAQALGSQGLPERAIAELILAGELDPEYSKEGVIIQKEGVIIQK